MLNVCKELAALGRMAPNDLRVKYAEVFGEETNTRNMAWLVKRIAWRLQAIEEGDLSERARRRAEELANDADLRVTPPIVKFVPDRERLMRRFAEWGKSPEQFMDAESEYQSYRKRLQGMSSEVVFNLKPERVQ